VLAAIALMLLVPASAIQARQTPAPPKNHQDRQHREHFIDSLLAKMTLQEKLGQLAQYSGKFAKTGPEAGPDALPLIKKGEVGSFLNIYGADYTCKLQHIAVTKSPHGIPLLFGYDVIHGFRTIFPVPLAMASSWEPQAVETAARVAADETSAAGVHWTFAPMVDIARDPRWGRIVEGAGEDPYLGSAIAAAAVHGFQGDNLADPDTVMATAKHFVGYGAAEGGRDYNTVDLSRRTLRDVYLPPYHAAVKAGVGSIMTAFNELNGVPMHENRALIRGVLRNEWHWPGVVVSDYSGIAELVPHGVAATRAQAGVLALRAGVDVDMIDGIYGHLLPAKVRQGKLSEKLVDQAVRRVLEAKYDLGLFANPYRYCRPNREAAAILTKAHRRKARQVARKSIVLLKNKAHTLPLSKHPSSLAVIGPLASDARSSLGPWSGAGRAKDAVTVLQGIKQAVSARTTVRYAKGVPTPVSADRHGIDAAVQLARRSDAVVLVVGEPYWMSGEAASRARLDLPGVQRQLAEAVIATGKPVVVVLMNGRPLALPWLDAHADAILETWYLGTETGPAVADVLFGDDNPGGKLPVTVPRTVGQVPLFYDHKNTGRPPKANQKYTSKYLQTPWTPLYPFGYGLSYTTFSYSAPKLSTKTMPASGSLKVRVRVTNTGHRAGDEVMQLYIRDLVASVTRPVKELRGFKRIHLAPGQSRVVHFTLTGDDLAFYDQKMRRVVEPGRFKVFAGVSSRNVKAASFRVVGPEKILGTATAQCGCGRER
jgi:beta-glucosidase